MRFLTPAVVALSALSSAVYGLATTGASAPASASSPAASSAGGTNAITAPIGDVPVVAGKPFTIKWIPNAGSTVTLILRSGSNSDNLDTLVKIAVDVDNSGSFTWTPSKNLAGGDHYAIQITSGGTTNYSPMFTISSSTTSSKTTKASSTTSSSRTSSSHTSSSHTSSSTTSSTTSSSTHKSQSKSHSRSNSTASTTTSGHSRNTTTTGGHASKTHEPSASASGSAESSITAASPTGNSAARSLSSPLALVLCIIASLAYFN